MTTSESVTQYGVVYPDGSEDWSVTASYGRVDDAPAQQAFVRMYEQRLASMGVPVPKDSIKFKKRLCTMTYSDVEDITGADPEEGTVVA